MSQKDIETLFSQLDSTVQLLRNEIDFSYLEALTESGSNLIEKNIPAEMKNILSPATADKLTEIYQGVDTAHTEPEDIRKSLQLAILKGLKEDKVQANHQMTPDAIGFMFVYFIEKVRDTSLKKMRILDPTVGTGNLLSTVYNALATADIEVEAEGIENDDLLIDLAAMATKLQRQNVKLTHQDAVQDLLVDPVDLVVSDLPIGYYPVDERAKTYTSAAKEGHSFAHHLLIEQSMKYLKPNAFGLFLVPKLMFETPEAASLMKAIQELGYLQGMLHLPKELFANEQSQKSILLLQKNGDQAEQAKQVLLGNIPDLKNQQSMLKFMQEVDNWKKENL
ncbi:class I SAM-dependent methyltransferase [Desemzia sp. RIT804]|nr:class I SAM-dependent methyltransferase [Desemzia sp. RIT 804]